MRIEIADANHRFLHTGFDAGDLRREGGNDKSFGLTGARVVKGANPDRIQALPSQLADHEVGGGFRGGVGIQGIERGRLVEGDTSCIRRSAVDFGGADEDKPGLRAMPQNGLGQIHCAVEIDVPGLPWGFLGLVNRGDGREMHDDIRAQPLHHLVCAGWIGDIELHHSCRRWDAFPGTSDCDDLKVWRRLRFEGTQ